MTMDTPTQATGTGEARAKKPFSRHYPAIARIVLGLPLFFSGLNAFLNFFPPQAASLPDGAGEFVGALIKTGYMLKLIGATHLIVGALLLSNRYVPLALALLAPFIVNAVAFHACLEHTGLPAALVFLALELYLAWIYRASYRPMLAARAERT
jgi:hypothetical protein